PCPFWNATARWTSCADRCSRVATSSLTLSPTSGTVASTTRSNTTCSRGCPATSCEKRSRSSEASAGITVSPTTKPACSSPTKRSCSISTRSAHRCEKQERRGEGAADQAHIEYEQIDTPTGKPLQESEPHRAVRQR